MALKAAAQTARAADPFGTCDMQLTGVCLAQVIVIGRLNILGPPLSLPPVKPLGMKKEPRYYILIKCAAVISSGKCATDRIVNCIKVLDRCSSTDGGLSNGQLLFRCSLLRQTQIYKHTYALLKICEWSLSSAHLHLSVGAVCRIT